jgi:hypothetical protein
VGLAFRLELARSRTVSRVTAASRTLAALGFGLAGLQASLGPTAALLGPEALRAGVGAALLLAAAGSLYAAGRALRPAGATCGGELTVDAGGRCAVRFDAQTAPLPVELVRAHILPGLILVALSPARAASNRPPGWRSRTLLLGRDSMPDDVWRCLSVWLQWMSRGRHDRPTGWK